MMTETRKQGVRIRNHGVRVGGLAVALVGLLAGCPVEQPPPLDVNWFTLKFTSSVVNKAAVDNLVISILQPSEAEERARTAPESEKYTYDVFGKSTVGGSGTTDTGASYALSVEDIDANARRDVVFRFANNPFSAAADSISMTLKHPLWGRVEDGGAIRPPPFTIWIKGTKTGRNGAPVTVIDIKKALAPGAIFAGPAQAPDAIPVACIPEFATYCNDPSGDAGTPPERDGGYIAPPDGGIEPQFTVTELKLEPTQVSLGQGLPAAASSDGGAASNATGIALSFKLTNLNDLEISRYTPTFLVDGTVANSLGFQFLPRAENQPNFPRESSGTLTFDVVLRNQAGTKSAEAGRHDIQLRMEAVNVATSGAADPDGGATTAGAEKTLRGPAAQSASIVVQNPPVLAVAPIIGPAEVFHGEQDKEIVITVTNTAGAPAAILRDLVVTPTIKQGETGDEPPAGISLEIVHDAAPTDGGAAGDPTQLVAGTPRTFKYKLVVAESGAPVSMIRIEATATGKDFNNPVAETLTTRATPKLINVRGSALVAALETSASESTVYLGQRDVKVTLVLDNKDGNDDARIANPRLKFLNRDGLDTAGPDRNETNAGWIVDAAIDPPLSTLVIPQREKRTLTFTVSCAARDNGQVGENTIQANFDYISVQRNTTKTVTAVANPGKVSVIFQPGPSLSPPASERDSRFGAALAGLGIVTASNANWPAVAVGAPDAAFGSGSVYFWQFVTATDGTAVARDLPKAAGLSGAKFGSALAGVGNWDRVSTNDLSNEVAIGRPGQSNFTIFSIFQSSPVTESLPTSFQPCSGCDLGLALAGNPRGRKEGANEALPRYNRRLLAVGAPKSSSGLGRLDIIWQRLSSEAGGQAFLQRRVDGEQIIAGASSGERFGAAITIADVDGDGDPDIIVGSPGYRKARGPTPADGYFENPHGRVRVLRGPDYLRFAPSWSFIEGDTEGEEFGTAVIGLGDIDGDGKDDFAVGSPKYSATPGAPQIGRVYVISGATGQRIYTLEGRVWTAVTATGQQPIGENFGSSLAPLFTQGANGLETDFNKDNRPDFAVGAPAASPGGKLAAGSAYVFSAPKEGATTAGKLLLRYDGSSPGDGFGSAVAGAGDLNGDGYHDLLVGAPNYVTPGDANQIKRGRVSVLYGGAFQPFQKRPQVQVVSIDDGATGTPAVRAVTIGQKTTTVRVTVKNIGDLAVNNLNASVILRKKVGAPPPTVPFTTVGCVDNVETAPPIATPNLARVCKRGTHPTTLGANTTAVLEFRVSIAETAQPEDWEFSLAVNADEGGIPELAVEQRRLWKLQRAAQIQVIAIQTTDGNTDLGFTSLNPGAPIELTADIINTGEAPVKELVASLSITVTGGTTTTYLDSQPLSLTPLRIGRNETARAKFRVSTTNAVLNGQEFEVRVHVEGIDENSSLPVANDLSAVTPVRVVTSRSRVRVTRVIADKKFVRPAETAVPFRSEIVYDFDEIIARGGSSAVAIQSAGLRFSVSPDAWSVPSNVGTGRSIGMCDHIATAQNPCQGDEFDVPATVPGVIAAGPVTVTGTVLAIDQDASDTGVMVRGFSDPDAFDTVQVLGLGTRVAEIAQSEPGFGAAVVSLGDMDGDGFGDFAVSAPQADGLRGKVFLFNGKRVADGSIGTSLGDLPGLTGRRSFGFAMAGGYNLNASTTDTAPDIVIGTPGADPQFGGAIAQYLKTSAQSPVQPEFLASSRRTADDRAGQAVAIGDVNNDGCPDIITGMPGSLDLGASTTRPRTGAVCVRFGTTGFDSASGGAPRTCAPPAGCGATPEVCWSEGAEGDDFGAAVAAWMPSGNGRFFLAVGAPGAALAAGEATFQNAGKVYVYPDVSCGAKPSAITIDANIAAALGDKAVSNAAFGAALGTTRLLSAVNPEAASPERLLIGAPGLRSCEAPGSICPGGTNCSNGVCQPSACGTDDSLCGTGGRCITGRCNRSTVGRVYALTDSPDQGNLKVAATGETPQDRFGAVVAAVGDVDGDSVGDIGIGAPGAQYGSLRNGRAQILSGKDLITLFQFGTSVAATQNVGRSIAGVGRVNDDAFNDVAIGADNKVFLVAGLERPAGASLRIDAVSAGVSEVGAGQTGIPVFVRITNVGSADAFKVVPTLLFKPVSLLGQLDASYAQTKIFELKTVNGATQEVEITTAAPLTIGNGSQTQVKILVSVGATATLGLTTIDAKVDARSSSELGAAVATQSADLTSSWVVKDPPRISIEQIQTNETVVFQGQRAIPVRVTIKNTSTTRPTQLAVRLKFRDTATNTEVATGYTFVQDPLPTAVSLVARACTVATVATTCAAGETCGVDGFCASGDTATVTLLATLAADAKLGEQELTAEVIAPPMPAPALGPIDVSKRQIWTVLPAGVVEVQKVAFTSAQRTCIDASTCGPGATCSVEGFCEGGSISLSAGQQRVQMTVTVKNTGSLILREVRPAIFFPVVADGQPTGRIDLTVPTIDASQPTLINPGEVQTMTFRLDVPLVAVLRRDGFGRVIVDARATARDANHSVEATGAATRAQFILQRPATPIVESATVQALIYRGEQKVKVSVTIANGVVATTCTTNANCVASGSTCVSGACTPSPDPTATWASIVPPATPPATPVVPALTPTLCFQNPVPAQGSSSTCAYSIVLDGKVQIAGVAPNPTEIAGNTRVTLRYEFAAPADEVAKLGDTRLRIIYAGKDKNTDLAIADVVYDRNTFVMNRDNHAGELLSPAIEAPEGALRFGYSLASAKTADARKGIFVAGAPDSDAAQGRVYVYGLGAPVAPATLGVVTQLARLNGGAAGDRFGDSVAILRNANGTARYIAVAAPGRSEQGVTAGGAIYFYDATTYALVDKRNGFEDNLRLGKLVASGNIDGDAAGSEDLLAGLPDYNGNRGRVLVISGAPPFDVRGAAIDGPIAEGRFGSALAGGSLLNSGSGAGAQNAGFLVGAPVPTGAGLTGYVRSYSAGGSVNGISLGCLDAARTAVTRSIGPEVAWGGRLNNFGTSIALLESVDDDTCPDIVIGAPGEDASIREHAGAIYIAHSGDGYFGSAPTEIRVSNRPGGNFGATVLSVGDWTNDGTPEIVIGAPTAVVGGLGTDGYPVLTKGVGLITVYYGNKNVSHFRAEGNRDTDQNFGTAIAALDLNDDGVLDLIVGAPGQAPGGSNGRVYIYQGGQVSGAKLKINSANDLGRDKVARGIPVAPWAGLEFQVTTTNAGKSSAVNVIPTLTFLMAGGAPGQGISVRGVTPCCDDRNGACVCANPTIPFPKEIPKESKFTWTFRLDVSSVTQPGQYAILARLTGADALTGSPIDVNSASVPEFIEIVQRNTQIAALSGDAPVDNNTSGFGAAVTSVDVDNDGFKDLVIAEPRQDKLAYGKVHVFSGRNLARRLISLEAPSGEGRNYTFGAKVAAARVGANGSDPGVPTVFVTQLDQLEAGACPDSGALGGGVFAYPLDCSASTCAVKARTTNGDRRWSATDLCGDQFGTGLTWMGTDTIDGTTADWLAFSSESSRGKVQLVSVTQAGMRVERRLEFDPSVPDGGMGVDRNCGGAITSRPAGAAGSTHAQLAMSCLDLGEGAGNSGVRVHTPATGASVDYFRQVNNSPQPNRQEDAVFGESIALLPDISGDGLGDVLIGWPKYNAGTVADVGRFEVWTGRATSPPNGTAPYMSVEGTVASSYVGMSVASVGDIDGDGVPDFAIGIPGIRTVRVYSGLSTDGFKRILMTITGDPASDAYKSFGASVTAVGDVNFDGFADIAVSAPEATVTVDSQTRRGAVYIFAGGHP